ncbi:hypothetical protein BEL01nite_79270 [Bradyrhizobium elkanii]|nr:hypothetical protein BEL01nite_79270 [Bradyrhizobium elkanii]
MPAEAVKTFVRLSLVCFLTPSLFLFQLGPWMRGWTFGKRARIRTESYLCEPRALGITKYTQGIPTATWAQLSAAQRGLRLPTVGLTKDYR